MNSTLPHGVLADAPVTLASDQLDPTATPGQWPAFLELDFRHRDGSSRLAAKRHQGPLYVQRPFYPEGRDLAHVYLLHPPGGLVSGDDLHISVQMAHQSRALLTTPGAGRVYGARSDRMRQRQYNHIRVAENASCEWFPQETIVYPGANAALETRIDLAGGSLFLGWEITVLGLPASDAPFDRGELRQRLSIVRDGRPLLVENLLLKAGADSLYDTPGGMRGFPVNGILVAGPLAGELPPDQMDALRETVLPGEAPCHWGVTQVDQFIVARYLGACAQQARRLFAALWALLRPLLLGRPAREPAIWAT